MRIHSDVLATPEFRQAAYLAGVDLIEFDESGSRSRARAFKFSLSGSSPYQRGFGASKNGEHAATWDEWGIFLAVLFGFDPNAHCGKNSYLSAEHFHWVTGNRFETLSVDDQHKSHIWGYGQPSATGTYSVSNCACGAIRRWILRPYTWDHHIRDWDENPSETGKPTLKIM